MTSTSKPQLFILDFCKTRPTLGAVIGVSALLNRSQSSKCILALVAPESGALPSWQHFPKNLKNTAEVLLLDANSVIEYIEQNSVSFEVAYPPRYPNVKADEYDYTLFGYCGETMLQEWHFTPEVEARLAVQKKRIMPFDKAMLVGVHLKEGSLAESGASVDEWQGFFEYCSQSHGKYTFVLFGHDSLLSYFQDCEKLKNVVIFRDYSDDINDHLLMITKCDFFMGMSSGLANMAIFSKIPYAIFKHPAHGDGKIQTLLKGASLKFALPNRQLFHVEEHSRSKLVEAFERVTR